MEEDNSIVIVGGAGAAAQCLIKRMGAAGMSASLISRRALAVPPRFQLVRTDLNFNTDWRAPPGAVIVSFLPLWILTGLLSCFRGASAIIAIGSTSCFTKSSSDDESERHTAAKLREAESALRSWAFEHHVTWTILRPTLIYDGVTDRNITRLARFIRKWHFLPLAHPANGLRQPIHADDVAGAVFCCFNNPNVADKAFNISGGETLTYRQMVDRVFAALGHKQRYVMLPALWLQSVFRCLTFLRLIKETNFGSSMFIRMNEDLIFDNEEGIKALDYRPRTFHPDFSRLLK